MNLQSIMKKATNYLNNFTDFFIQCDIEPGYIMTHEIFDIFNTHLLLHPELFNIWDTVDKNFTRKIYNMFMDINDKSIESKHTLFVDAVFAIKENWFKSIAILLKLKAIYDDNKNGFITYDAQFYLEQMKEHSSIKGRIKTT